MSVQQRHPRPKRDEKNFACPIEETLHVIGGRWKCLILWHLRHRPQRPGTLRRWIPGVSEKVLLQQLRQLRQDGVVERVAYPEVPPRVEYGLTDRGRTLLPILSAMCDWPSSEAGRACDNA